MPGILQVCLGPARPSLTPSELALAAGLASPRIPVWPGLCQGAPNARGLSNSSQGRIPAQLWLWFLSQAGEPLFLLIPGHGHVLHTGSLFLPGYSFPGKEILRAAGPDVDLVCKRSCQLHSQKLLRAQSHRAVLLALLPGPASLTWPGVTYTLR